MAKVTLSPEALFFLSKIMKAKYLDYDYVSMMSDISQRLALKQSQAMDELGELGLIFEDFTGEIEIEDLAKELFEPIFFGTFESEFVMEDSIQYQRFKYHVLDGKYVEVEMANNKLIVQSIEKEMILNHLPYMEALAHPQVLPIDYFENVKVEGILILKGLKFNKKSTVVQFVNDCGIYYQAKGDKIYSMTKEDMTQQMKSILWEV